MPARMPGTESGSVTRRNALERARAEVARGLDLALVDAVERDEQRQDQERDVAVDEREDHGRRLPVQPAARLGEQAEREEHLLDPEVVQEPRAEAVRATSRLIHASIRIR